MSLLNTTGILEIMCSSTMSLLNTTGIFEAVPVLCHYSILLAYLKLVQYYVIAEYTTGIFEIKGSSSM